MKTHDIGPLFWHTTRLTKEAPLIHVAKTNETEDPYRVSKSLVLKLTGTFALVLGCWRASGFDEWEALMDALDYQELAEWDDLGEKLKEDVRANPNPSGLMLEQPPRHLALDPDFFKKDDDV